MTGDDWWRRTKEVLIAKTLVMYKKHLKNLLYSYSTEMLSASSFALLAQIIAI